MLEAVDAMVADQLGHFLAHLLAPPGNRHMEAIVGRGFFRPAAPLVKRVHQGLLRVGDHKVDDRRSAPRQACCRATEKSSLATVPMKGSCMWVWGSMPPGIKY